MKNRMIKLIVACKPYSKYILIILAVTIMIISSIPNIPTLKIHTERKDIRLDYLIHFAEYGILTFIAFLTFASDKFRMKYNKTIFIVACLIVFAYLDEFHQKFIPGRTYNIIDFISNISGVLAATVFCVLVFRLIARRSA